jgi:CheY-like chemotaxis protein
MNSQIRDTLLVVIGESDEFVFEKDVNEVNDYPVRLGFRRGLHVLGSRSADFTLSASCFEATCLLWTLSIRHFVVSTVSGITMVVGPIYPPWVPLILLSRLFGLHDGFPNNAAKYTDEGGHIWLSAEQEGDLVVLRVRDTGAGIAADLLENIFDPFSQAERTIDRAEGGLGIGLTLVQKIVELHHGHVEARSAGIGQGSEFTVWLPVFGPESRESNVSASRESVAQTAKILIVDDNVDATDTLASVLRLVGHDVQVAYSGESALEVAMEFQPTIVLLDIGLPEINGYEVARRLRQRQQSKDTWLIAMTGYGQDSDRQRSHEAGFDYHLVKPVDPEKLAELFTTLMRPPS